MPTDPKKNPELKDDEVLEKDQDLEEESEVAEKSPEKKESPEEDEEELDPLDDEEEIEEKEDKEEEEDANPYEQEDVKEPVKTFSRDQKEDVEEQPEEEQLESAYPVRSNLNQPGDLHDLADQHPQVEEEEDGDRSLRNLRATPASFNQPSRPQVSFYQNSAQPPRQNQPFNPSYASSRPLGGNRSKATKFHLFVLLALGIAVIGGTVYLLRNQFQFGGDTASNIEAPVVTSPEPVASSTPTPTPLPEIDRSEYTVRVLNGTDTSGLAGTVKTKMEELGYETTAAGNATNSAFQKTVVRAKASAVDALAQLIEDLKPDYNAEISTPLPSSNAADLEVILGQE